MQIKNKEGQYNPHHLFTTGLSFQNRRLLNGDFRTQLGNTIADTVGYVLYYQDTIPTATFVTSYKANQTMVNSKQLLINIGYQYSFFPSDKFNVSLGTKIGAGYVCKEFLLGKNFTYTSTESVAFNGIQAGMYYNMYDQKSFYNEVVGGFNVFACGEVALGWRLSKTVPILRNINVTASGRFGWDAIKMKRSAFYGNLYYSTSFGISYIFDKYYKS